VDVIFEAASEEFIIKKVQVGELSAIIFKFQDRV
jgi:hypothetical protein